MYSKFSSFELHLQWLTCSSRSDNWEWAAPLKFALRVNCSCLLLPCLVWMGEKWIIGCFLVEVRKGSTYTFSWLNTVYIQLPEKGRVCGQTFPDLNKLWYLWYLWPVFFCFLPFFFFLRDLLNWCNRIAHSFDSLSSSASLNIFQEVRYSLPACFLCALRGC